MSNYLSIAVVTATLQEMIQQALDAIIAGVTVRIGPPRPPGPAAGPEVSLYLYLLSPNLNLRNQDLPTRTAGGVLLQSPFMAVDLHYVISFFGEQDLASERMLGKLVSHLNAFPILTPELIRATLRPTGAFRYLDSSDLADAPDLIKLTPYFPTLEEISKLWTVFFQMAHHMSLLYTVGPVLVDAGLTPTLTPAVSRQAIATSHIPSPHKGGQ
jgi:hypothetical protein